MATILPQTESGALDFPAAWLHTRLREHCSRKCHLDERPIMTATTHYKAPSGFDAAFNRAVRWLADRGVNLAGAQTLTVVGRKTGMPQRVPVNVLRLDGAEYLVAVRGDTQWVRNARVAGTVELRRGRRRAVVTLTEIDPALRPPVIREYLRRWRSGGSCPRASSSRRPTRISPPTPG
jgi:deazaflavin-dependent oxidoreductase (nitroreductase family)